MAKLKLPFPFILLVSLLIFCLIQGSAVSADDVKWSRVNIPTQGNAGDWLLANGSDVHHLKMSANGTLFAYVPGLTYTLYRSEDSGYRWSYIGNVQDSIVDIAVSPEDEDKIYYATSASVYRSTDGGKKFFQLGPNPGDAGSNNIEITDIDVAHFTSNVIAAATRDTDTAEFGSVYILDEEQVITSWADSNIGSFDVYAVAFSPGYAADRQLVAVATDETDTLVRFKIGDSGWGTTFGNATLDKDNSGTPASVVAASSAAIAFPTEYDGTSPDTALFVAIDAGTDDGDVYKIVAAESPANSSATDLNVGSAYGLSNIDITGLAVSSAENTVYLLAGAADSAQTYYSEDEGRNWTRSRKKPTGGSHTCVLMNSDFNVTGQAYAATRGSDSAFSLSNDGGVTWNQIGLIDAYISDIRDFAPSLDYGQDSALFLLTFGADYCFWRSTDGGRIWERLFSSSLDAVDTIDLVELSPEYGNDSQVLFLAGNSNGKSVLWRSVDSGQRYTKYPTADPDSGTSLPVHACAVVDDNTLFIGTYVGSNAYVYGTTNGGYTYRSGSIAGSQIIYSMALSPDFEHDGTILIGDSGGWIYLSSDNRGKFEPLPPDATASQLSGLISVAFAQDFSSNQIVYAASDTADKGIYRFKIGSSDEWESIDGTLPSGGKLNEVIVAPSGVLYASNTKADGGMERCLNPTYSLGPTFETITRGLSDGVRLSKLWFHGYHLWATDTDQTKLLTYYDTFTVPATLLSPADNGDGIGALINHTVSNVHLDWGAESSATLYEWQIDFDTDLSSVPTGFEGTTKASTTRLPTLEPATTYYWRARVKESALSPWSPKWSFTTCLDTDTTSIKLESPKSGETGVPVKPLFQWSAVPEAVGYELLVSSDIQFSNLVISRTGDFSLPATAWQGNLDLALGTTYYWKVRAVSADTKSAWSAVGTFITELPPPSLVQPSAPSAAMIPVPTPTPAPSPAPAPVPPAPAQTLPPAPPPAPVQQTPDLVVYLIGALLLAIILLIVTILVLAFGLRRS
jgi:hypothetical protein